MLFQCGMQMASLKFKDLTEPVIPWRLKPPLYPPLSAHPLVGNQVLFADVCLYRGQHRLAGMLTAWTFLQPPKSSACLPGGQAQPRNLYHQVVLRCVAHREGPIPGLYLLNRRKVALAFVRGVESLLKLSFLFESYNDILEYNGSIKILALGRKYSV